MRSSSTLDDSQDVEYSDGFLNVSESLLLLIIFIIQLMHVYDFQDQILSKQHNFVTCSLLQFSLCTNNIRTIEELLRVTHGLTKQCHLHRGEQ